MKNTVFWQKTLGFHIFCVSLFLSLPPLWVMGPTAKTFPISLCFSFLHSRKPYAYKSYMGVRDVNSM